MTALFFVFRLIGLINELQRSESIDLQRLLHLPVSLGQIFVRQLPRVASRIECGPLLPRLYGNGYRTRDLAQPDPCCCSCPWRSRDLHLIRRGLLSARLAGDFVSNPRRRRTVIMCIHDRILFCSLKARIFISTSSTLSTGLHLGATPAEARLQREAKNKTNEGKFISTPRAQKIYPAAVVPVGAQALAEGRAPSRVARHLGMFRPRRARLRRAYRSTLRFYHGESGGGKIAARQKPFGPGRCHNSHKSRPRSSNSAFPACPNRRAHSRSATFPQCCARRKSIAMGHFIPGDRDRRAASLCSANATKVSEVCQAVHRHRRRGSGFWLAIFRRRNPASPAAARIYFAR